MSGSIEVRGVLIGKGMPKIIVPIVGKTEEEILRETEKAAAAAPDLVEWRADWFAQVMDGVRVKEVLGKIRERVENIPLLYTFRTAAEGGEMEIRPEDYVKLCREAASGGQADLLDVELSMGEQTVRQIIETAHHFGVRVIASSHDFHATPPGDEILRRLKKMQALGADVLKIAVTPQDPSDVLVLLDATREMACRYADRPLITMSMGKTGAVSRLCGETFGSAATFGTAGRSSAPGQIPVPQLREILRVLHGAEE
ncbi:MAG: type I 3-dehydroquinate dehydratase [Lachnospiraceae bacterium]|nr:type I 3-dehydroquinate dehydratase [Lachnospiraceae bacterium]